MHAAIGNVDCTKILIDAGANLELIDIWKSNALMRSLTADLNNIIIIIVYFCFDTSKLFKRITVFLLKSNRKRSIPGPSGHILLELGSLLNKINIKDGVQTNNDSRCHGLANFVSNEVRIRWKLRLWFVTYLLVACVFFLCFFWLFFVASVNLILLYIYRMTSIQGYKPLQRNTT